MLGQLGDIDSDDRVDGGPKWPLQVFSVIVSLRQ
jgi:hypothetical protein